MDLTGLSGTIEAQVSVWVEAPSLFPTLNILSSLGVDRKVEVGPNGGVPIYTRVILILSFSGRELIYILM